MDQWPTSAQWPKVAVYVDDHGSIARCQLASPGAARAAAAAPELLTGIARLLESRAQSFGALLASYDLDGDGKLDSLELEALAADALGQDAGGALRYFQVLLDADGDGLVAAGDLCEAAQRLCVFGGPALLAKERPDVGDALVALAGRMGASSGWRAQVRALFARHADGCDGKIGPEALLRLLRSEMPQLTAREARRIVAHSAPYLGTSPDGHTSLRQLLAALEAYHPSSWGARGVRRRSVGGTSALRSSVASSTVDVTHLQMSNAPGSAAVLAGECSGDSGGSSGNIGGSSSSGGGSSSSSGGSSATVHPEPIQGVCLRVRTHVLEPPSAATCSAARLEQRPGPQQACDGSVGWIDGAQEGSQHGGGSSGNGGGMGSSDGEAGGDTLLDRLAALAAEPLFSEVLAGLQPASQSGYGSAGLAPIAALLSAAGAATDRLPTETAVSQAAPLARAALHLAMSLVKQLQQQQSATQLADSGSSACASPMARAVVIGAGEPSDAPMQELLHMLESSPGRLQAAFALRACSDRRSPSFSMQPRHSLLPLSELPAVLGEVMPHWPPRLVSYVAVQLSWHVNVVSYTSDSPVGHARLSEAEQPSNMMYAEMAASIIAAAETEAAATDSRLLPGAQQFVSAVCEALGAPQGNGRLLRLWEMQGAGISPNMAEVASALVDYVQAQGQHGLQPLQLDNRPRAWLAAALLSVLGTGADVSMGDVVRAAAHLQKACGAGDAVATLVASAAGASAPMQVGSGGESPQWRGSLGHSIVLRRWRVDSSWSRGSGGDGSLGGCPPPWRGAVSGNNSSDVEQPQPVCDVLALAP